MLFTQLQMMLMHEKQRVVHEHWSVGAADVPVSLNTFN